MPSATKRLILCCDGSWTPSKSSSPATAYRPSNVARISRMLARHAVDDVPQIVFHVPGRNTAVEHDVASAYLFLAANYAPDDEIAVFGAGRGATVARLVVALVTEVGVLRASEVGRWADVWALWMRREKERESGGERRFFWKDVLAHRSRGELDAIEELRGKVWTGIRVMVIGAWDTVEESSKTLGGGDEQYRLPDLSLNSSIEHAFQALALDESRADFAPALWRLDPKDDISPEERITVLKQCWFPGFHETAGSCDGDTADSKDGTDIADITLAWMCDQVDGLLTFDETAVAEFLNAEQIAQTYSTTANTELRKGSKPRSTRSANQKANSLLIAVLTHVVTFLTAITALLNHSTALLDQSASQGSDEDEPSLAIRTPGQYHKNLEFEAGSRPDDFATNESVHPSVKHRQDLFALARVPYSPAPLREWPTESTSQPRNHHHLWSNVSFISSFLNDDHATTKGDEGSNAINAAADHLLLQDNPLRKPHPEWTYRESAHGDGAKWKRPSVPRSSVFFASSSPKSSTPLLPSFLSGSLLLVCRALASAFVGRSTMGAGVGGGRGNGGLEWGYERQVELPEWVIREVPGRHNFEARLLPWLVREQLRWRNRNRLDWMAPREEVWARTVRGIAGLGSALVGAGEMGQIEWNAGVGGEMEVARGKRSREGEVVVAGAVKRRAAGPLHIRKGSGAGVGADAERAQSPRHCIRRSVSLSTSPSTAVVRAERVGRVSPVSSAGSSTGRRGSAVVGGDGLKALVQQPVRRAVVGAASGKGGSREREAPVFLPGHRKSHSQTSVSWR